MTEEEKQVRRDRAERAKRLLADSVLNEALAALDRDAMEALLKVDANNAADVSGAQALVIACRSLRDKLKSYVNQGITDARQAPVIP